MSGPCRSTGCRCCGATTAWPYRCLRQRSRGSACPRTSSSAARAAGRTACGPRGGRSSTATRPPAGSTSPSGTSATGTARGWRAPRSRRSARRFGAGTSAPPPGPTAISRAALRSRRRSSSSTASTPRSCHHRSRSRPTGLNGARTASMRASSCAFRASCRTRTSTRSSRRSHGSRTSSSPSSGSAPKKAGCARPHRGTCASSAPWPTTSSAGCTGMRRVSWRPRSRTTG